MLVFIYMPCGPFFFLYACMHYKWRNGYFTVKKKGVTLQRGWKRRADERERTRRPINRFSLFGSLSRQIQILYFFFYFFLLLLFFERSIDIYIGIFWGLLSFKVCFDVMALLENRVKKKNVSIVL